MTPLDLLLEKLLTSAIVRCPFLSEGAKITFLCLLSYDRSEIAVSEIATARGKNDSTIQLHIRELKKQKYIKIVDKGGEKNSMSIYSYHPENVFKSMGFSKKVCKALMNRNSVMANEIFEQLAEPDFLFYLTKKLHEKNIELPNSNENVRFFNKRRKNYNRGDVVKYYRVAYKNRTGVPHRMVNKRDLVLCSRLLKRYTPTILCKVIDHTFSKRGNFVFLTFDVFYRNADRYFRHSSKRKQDSPNFKKSKKRKAK